MMNWWSYSHFSEMHIQTNKTGLVFNPITYYNYNYINKKESTCSQMLHLVLLNFKPDMRIPATSIYGNMKVTATGKEQG